MALENWRMVAAAPGLTDEQKAAITADIEKMAKSAALEEGRWPTRAGPTPISPATTSTAQLADGHRRRPAAILKDIGLVK